MKVGIITPYYREAQDVLRTCHESVQAQTHACEHFMIADGFPRPEVSNWEVQHIVLARSHGDGGNTPRAIGSLSAINQGFDAIAYLDADNWYYPNHVAEMIELHRQTGAAICTATRTVHRQDGSLLFVDRLDSDGRRHVDASCYFFTKRAFRLAPIWATMPGELGPVGDRAIWSVIQALGLPCAHHSEPTVAFRTQYQEHYRHVGEEPPPESKSNEESTGKAMQWWANLAPPVKAEWERRMGFRR